jgi:hypothetical protein
MNTIKKIMSLLFFGFLAQAQMQIAQTSTTPGLKSKVNLEDVTIKGQSNRNQGGFSRKDKHDLFSRIKIRRDFRDELLKNLPQNYETLPLKPKL